MNYFDILLARKLAKQGDITTESLSVTANGTYTAPSGKAYTPVNVAVEGYALKSLATPSEVASFNAAELPLNKLKVGINAVQDLHGYDHPWVGGAGKNKLPMTVDGIKALNTGGTWNNNTYSINGGTLTIMTDNSGDVVGINVNGNFSSQTDIRLVGSYGSTTTFIGQGSYYINCANAITETEIHYGYGTSVFGRLNNTSDKRVDITGSNLGMSFVMLRLLNGILINVTLKPMIRLASETDATFEPYSNICPISGWDAANVSDVDDVDNPTVTQTTTVALPQTVYGGELDVVNGVLTITHEYIASYNGETLPSTWISSMDVYAEGTTPTIGAEVCYERANPISTNLTPTLIKSLNGQNNLSVDCGEVMECEWLESL